LSLNLTEISCRYDGGLSMAVSPVGFRCPRR
jgi:hypothetical protein